MDLNTLIDEAKEKSADEARCDYGGVHHWLLLVLEKLPVCCLTGYNTTFEEQTLMDQLVVIIECLPKEELNGCCYCTPSKNSAISFVGWATQGEYVKLLEMFLKAGADPNGLFRGKPAIWNATRGVSPECLELLVRYGAKCPKYLLGPDQTITKFDLRLLLGDFRAAWTQRIRKILDDNVCEFERTTNEDYHAMMKQYKELHLVTFVPFSSAN